MKKTLDKLKWTYEGGKLIATGEKSDKHFEFIDFTITLDPTSGAGQVEFSSFYRALNKVEKVTGGMEEIERTINEYFKWVRSLWGTLPMEDITKALAWKRMIIGDALIKVLGEAR